MSAELWCMDLLLWSVQAAVLTLAAALLVKILRIREPRALLVCWRTVGIASLILPLVEPWRRPGVFVPAGPEISITSTIPAANVAPPPWHFPSLTMIAEIFAVVAALGVVVRFAMLGLGLLKLRQLRRKSVAIAAIAASAGCAGTLEQARALAGGRAEFRLSGEVESPVTFGFASPVILLPERFVQLDERFQTAIAYHELLHVRRRDWTHHLCEEIFRVIFWFHPAILWLVAQIRLAREQIVDLEVVKFTEARKLYVEALLEFTSGRRGAAIPAPPFLAERQLVERVGLMLKEVRMSRTRLIASLCVVGSVVAAAGVVAVSILPLKAAPRTAARAEATQEASQPMVNASSIWPGEVKQGTIDINVRGLGTLLPASPSGGRVVKIEMAETQAGDIRVGQGAEVDTHKGIVKAHVISVSSEVVEGTRGVFVALDSAVPGGVGANAVVEGTIQVAKLENVVYVGRPVHGDANSQGRLFKIIDHGKEAEQVQVKYGRASVKTIQVLSGLKPGDRVILSDMSAYDKFDRIEIKQSPSPSAPSVSPASSSDAPLAGEEGYASPTCAYCPMPQYSVDAYRKKIQGKVVLSAVIATDGRAHDTKVVRGLGHGLDEQAIHSVRDMWRFKPANGPNGQPTAVRMLIDINFHLYGNR